MIARGRISKTMVTPIHKPGRDAARNRTVPSSGADLKNSGGPEI